MIDLAAVLPAGGAGTRLGTRTPKQFLALGRTPILAVTASRFTRYPGMRVVVVAAPEVHLGRARRTLARAARGAPVTVVAGGPTRQDSVWCGLREVPAGVDVVVVHDAVRPLITRRLIDDVVAAAVESGAATCGLPIIETVKRVRQGCVEATLDRSELWAVQTPQAFRADLLREAHVKARRDGVVGTDDAMLVERLGHPVRVVMGLPGNVKITTPEDLRRARETSRP